MVVLSLAALVEGCPDGTLPGRRGRTAALGAGVSEEAFGNALVGVVVGDEQPRSEIEREPDAGDDRECRDDDAHQDDVDVEVIGQACAHAGDHSPVVGTT
jgi:hypothetical protein